jgi:hypothetical protein
MLEAGGWWKLGVGWIPSFTSLIAVNIWFIPLKRRFLSTILIFKFTSATEAEDVGEWKLAGMVHQGAIKFYAAFHKR